MTTTDLLAKWNAMTPRERDAWVAENVMGWERRDGIRPWVVPLSDGTLWLESETPAYSTDPAADYAVLEQVRKTFTVEHLVAFDNALSESWTARYWEQCDSDPEWEPSLTQYQPGDYSLAAFLVLANKEAP